MKRENLQFGHGDAKSAILEPNFSAQPIDEQARVFGWANGCPVVEELISVRGAEKMVPRYREVNMWFRRTRHELQKLKPKEEWLTTAPSRMGDVGKHEPDSVPDWHRTNIPPMGTLVGYSLPRLLVEQSATGLGVPEKEGRRRTGVALDALKEGVQKGRSVEEVMAVTAEQIRRSGDLEPEVILQRILPAGWLVEHPEQLMVQRFKNALSKESRELWRLYESLTPKAKKALELA